MNNSQFVALILVPAIFVLIGLWIGWEQWGAKLKREREDNAKRWLAWSANNEVILEIAAGTGPESLELQVSRLVPKPGDHFVVASAAHLSTSQKRAVLDSIKRFLPDNPAFVIGPDMQITAVDQAQAECVRLQGEAAKSERRAIAFGDVVNSHVVAMRAAVVAAKLEGLEVGMQWISNTLCGPGHLPDIDEAKELGGAQALWDKETAEHEAFRAAHPGP